MKSLDSTPPQSWEVQKGIRRPSAAWAYHVREKIKRFGLLAEARLVHRDNKACRSLCAPAGHISMLNFTHVHLNPIYTNDGPSWVDLTHPDDFVAERYNPYHLSAAWDWLIDEDDPMDAQSLTTLRGEFSEPKVITIQVQRISHRWSYMVSSFDEHFGHPLGSSSGENHALGTPPPSAEASQKIARGSMWRALWHLRTLVDARGRPNRTPLHDDTQFNISA